MSNVSDQFGRPFKYIRISVTDRCNFRCKYCMPDNNFKHLKCEEIMRYEDILFAVSVFAELGVNRVRITGGEPLVRAELPSFLQELTKINGINEVMLTTNGALLEKYAKDLAKAGVKRLNISLDSLKPERNRFITGIDKDYNIINGIIKAKEEGLNPIKVNAVVIRDFNDDEIADFAELSAKLGIICRFIEFMPIGNVAEWSDKSIVKGDEIIERLAKFQPEKMARDKNTGPAVNYRLNNGGIIGIITPISKHFCNDCDKLRLTSDGKIRPCLLSDNEIDLMPALKNRDKDGVINAIMQVLGSKHKEHNVSTDKEQKQFRRTMSKIGG